VSTPHFLTLLNCTHINTSSVYCNEPWDLLRVGKKARGTNGPMGLMAFGYPLAGIHESIGLDPGMGTHPDAQHRIRGSSHLKTILSVALGRPCAAGDGRCKLVSRVGMVKASPLEGLELSIMVLNLFIAREVTNAPRGLKRAAAGAMCSTSWCPCSGRRCTAVLRATRIPTTLNAWLKTPPCASAWAYTNSVGWGLIIV